jgi:shikimate dehydrogenase
VLGSPIEHSLSPVLHAAAYVELGLDDWSYERFEVTETELPEFVARCDATWRGLSLTMPLKAVALELGQVDPIAALVGAANTLVFSDGGRQVYNTDVGGLVSALTRAGATNPRRVTILGSGATARSALVSASQLGATVVTLAARDLGKADRLRSLAQALGLELSVQHWDEQLPPADLVISTVTAGAADARAALIAASAPVIFDALYDPWPTPLARAAERAGRTVVNGLDLLVGQAIGQIELMTGLTIAAEVLLSAGRAALRASAG